MKPKSLLSLVLIVVTLAACSGQPNTSIGSVTPPWGNGPQVWITKPLSNLNSSADNILVGLALSDTLTLAEAKVASEGIPLKMRVIYFATESGGGSFAKPEAVSFDEAFGTAYDFLNSIAGQQANVVSQEASKFLGLNSSGEQISSQSVQGFNVQNLNNPTLAIQALEASPELSSQAKELVVVRRENEAISLAAKDEAAIVYGMQIEGSAKDILAYAERVKATGYTDEEWQLYNAIQPKMPTELELARKAYDAWKTGESSSDELYQESLTALEYFNIGLGGAK